MATIEDGRVEIWDRDGESCGLIELFNARQRNGRQTLVLGDDIMVGDFTRAQDQTSDAIWLIREK